MAVEVFWYFAVLIRPVVYIPGLRLSRPLPSRGRGAGGGPVLVKPKWKCPPPGDLTLQRFDVR